MSRRSTSGATLVKGVATIPAGALAHGVAAAAQVVPVAPCAVGDEVIVSQPTPLPGLLAYGHVTAANVVTIYSVGLLAAGIVVPAAYVVEFEIEPRVP